LRLTAIDDLCSDLEHQREPALTDVDALRDSAAMASAREFDVRLLAADGSRVARDDVHRRRAAMTDGHPPRVGVTRQRQVSVAARRTPVPSSVIDGGSGGDRTVRLRQLERCRDHPTPELR